MTKLVPGPGTYVNHYDRQTSAPKWGFGSCKRPTLANKFVTEVGPGQYKVPNKAIEGKLFSMGSSKRGGKYDSISPGPGKYMPK